MKKLPIGKQDLESLINGGYVYVDKTEIIHRLISTGSVYFLSRPRRFGKSLLVSTLKEIYSGNKELFKGLWIYDKHIFKKHPIIHIDFSEMGIKEKGAQLAITDALTKIALENNIVLGSSTPGSMFSELIQKLATPEAKVAILIDEYDKPIIDYMNQMDIAKENRDILKNFYAPLKGNDEHIEFLFLTGVSKFSKVSIFSDLNHLNDITLNDQYATIVGYTEKELYLYFMQHLALAGQRFDIDKLLPKIKLWYNGYSWDGLKFVYNPFSILNFLSQLKFGNYWFATGTPTFLTELMQKRNIAIEDINNISVNSSVFDKYELDRLETIALLFQTGYLTIKSYDINTERYLLAYPNKEVEHSFEEHLLGTYVNKGIDANAVLVNRLLKSLNEKNIELFIKQIKSLYKNIPYPIIDDDEKYYHTVFHLMLNMMCVNIESEVLTSDGRIDAVIKTENYIYVIEFKMGSAKKAIEQIHKKHYHLKFANEGRQVILLGIGFDETEKNIGEWVVA